jgi:hypothetical protein
MDEQTRTQTPLQALETLSKIASNQASPPYQHQYQTQYDTFLGVQKTSTNLLFIKTVTLVFILQFALFYSFIVPWDL